MYAFATPFVTPLCPRPRLGVSPQRLAHAPTAAPGRHAARQHATGVRMVISTEDETVLRITGNNITITDSLREYIKSNLSKVIRKYSSLITKIDVHLAVEHNPAIAARHKAEVVVFAGKTILRSEHRDTDMYTAIDLVEERINRTIRKFKERRTLRSRKNGNAIPVPIVSDEEEEEDDQDPALQDTYADVGVGAALIPPVTEVVKRKVFPMPLQTVEEAVLCCEYVDHPWYLFRNAQTGEIALVYKRNHGGYGLIEPSNPDAVDED